MIQQQQKQKMFNTYIYTKTKTQQKLQQQQYQNLQKWSSHYKQKIQPYLISRYQRRINGFAKKMQDQPIIIKQNKNGNIQDILIRCYDRKLNIGQDNFRFKSQSSIVRNNKDRLSYYTKSDKYNQSISLSRIRTIQPQPKHSQYKVRKIQYRTRHKDKEINPPMRYINKKVQLSLPKMNLDHQNRHKNNKTQILNRNNIQSIKNKKKNNIIMSDDQQQNAQNLNHQQGQSSTINNSHIYKSRDNNNNTSYKTQIQIIQQQQMKALAQKKLYFKSLIDLQQNVKTIKQRNNLREILVKCGIFKPITGKIYEEQQIDKFLELMKTKHW